MGSPRWPTGSSGRPLTYATTTEFLTHFGLASRRDLPGIADLKAAGLLDPVDFAFEGLQMAGEHDQGDMPNEGDEALEIVD